MPTTINASNTTGGAVVTGDGSGVLELQSGGVTGLTITNGIVNITSGTQSPMVVAGTASVGAQIRLNEATANGTNFVAVKAADNLAANTTFTLPTADGTNGQYLRTDGAGNLAFATVPVTSPAGTTGQVQINNAGAFGAVASGTSGQVLTSNGAGVAPSFATPNPVPGAFGQFSVVGLGNQNVQYFAASASDMLIPGGFAANPVSSYNTGTGAYINPVSFFYSTYYSSWFCVALETQSGLQNGIYASRNGLNWTPVLMNFRGKAGAPSTAVISRAAIDDSNGALFVVTTDNSNLLLTTYASAGTNWNSFTAALNVNYGGSAGAQDILYIDTGSVSTSAMVLIINIDGTISLRTCNPGTTSFTTRIASGAASGPILYNRASGFGFSGGGNNATTVSYFTNNNAQTGWTNNTSVGASINATGGYAISNGVMVGLTAADSLVYSTTGSGTWTAVTSFAGGNTTYAMMHNGTAWVALTAGGLYFNTNSLPTGAWTRLPASGAIGMQSYAMRQRYI